MYGLAIFGSSCSSCGVFGSVKELAGKPLKRFASPGMEQSVCPGLGFADDAPHGWLKLCVTKKGGLNPGLGFDHGPVS